MKKLTLVLAVVLYGLTASAQEDTIKINKPDTIRIGNILIIKKDGKRKTSANPDDSSAKASTTIVMSRSNSNPSRSRVTTNWWIVDLGFANYNDQTNYANTGTFLVNNPAPGVSPINANDFKLRTVKSINVNIWFFMQKINLIKSNVNLKYGLGLELNNYRYKSGLTYREGGARPYGISQQPTNTPFIFRQDSVSFTKNKLAADYLTVPVMLNFSSTPHNDKKSIGFSAGISAGYLYAQRNKQKSSLGDNRNRGEYDLEKFKISYIAELALGPVKLYGSYSTKSMYEHDLSIRPYTFGFRLSNL
ncbi:MAG: hypothetical protein ABIO05_03455 [Ferruginibacter sp.]